MPDYGIRDVGLSNKVARQMLCSSNPYMGISPNHNFCFAITFVLPLHGGCINCVNELKPGDGRNNINIGCIKNSWSIPKLFSLSSGLIIYSVFPYET